MSTLKVDTIQTAAGTGSLTVPAETGTVVTTASPSLGRRNLIINGAMQVWQRGTSFSSSGYTADRWSWSGGGAGSISRQSFTVGSEIEDSPYYLRWAITGNSQNLELLQKIEDVRTAAGKTCTLSFWAKSSSNETLGWAVYQNFGSGGSSLTAADGGTYTATTSWQKFTFTFDMPSISGKTIGTNHYVWVRIAQMQTTNTPTLDFAGVQLEVGSVATPFEYRSYGEELALCQRYYQTGNPNMIAHVVNSGLLTLPIHPTVSFRASPSVEFITSPYVENVPWNSVGSVTLSNTTAAHLTARGGEIGLFGSYSPTPSVGQVWLVNASELKMAAEL